MHIEPMDQASAGLDRVVLSCPSVISLRAEGEFSRSWNQVATVGTFYSQRYKKFSITKTDVSDMKRNFDEVTPKAPTELPVDYDHLSMDPKKPGDGQAAGWIKQLELRNNGTELWMEVEWTKDAADAIKEKKYRFVSPSFVKDYTHKDGRKIGTTLLAAAITNHPFLEGMQALTLYSFSAMGDLALANPDETTVNLADLGQRVTFVNDAEKTPELTTDERRGTYIVKTAIGGGEDQFVRLTTPDGQEFGWFRVTQLTPARAVNANPMPKDQQLKKESQQENNPMPTNTKPEVQMSATEELALKLTKDTAVAAKNLTADDARSYMQEHNIGGCADPVAEPEPDYTFNGQPLSLSTVQALKGATTFDQAVMNFRRDTGLGAREGYLAVARLRPDLAEAH